MKRSSYFILGLEIFSILINKQNSNFSWPLYNNVNVVNLLLSSLVFLHSEPLSLLCEDQII